MLLRISTVRAALADSINNLKSARRKTPKGGTKGARAGKDTWFWAKLVRTFRTPAILKTAPLACERKAA